MILHELKALALREGLVDDPAFESKAVPWIIVLDEDGNYLGLRDTYQEVPLPEGKKGKLKRQASMFAVPRRVIRSVNDASDFLVDKSEYVLGVEPDGKRSADDLVLRSSLYMDLLNEANASLHNKALASVIAFLQDSTARMKCVEELSLKGYASNNLFTFRVDGDLLHEDEAIRAWWSARPVPTKKKKKQARTDRQCLICGIAKAAVDNHNKVQVLGTSGNGAPLVGFNKPAFLKYGLEGNDNAPICRECMTAYVEGLRRLVNARYIDPRRGGAFPVQNVRLSGDTTAVYWASIPDELVGTLSELMYAPQKVRDLLNSPHHGQRSAGSAERFFCLVVSGAQGRAMLRSMHTGTLAELEHNLHRFFDAIRLDGDHDGPKPLGFLLRSLVLQEKLDRLPPGLALEVFLGILSGRKLPRLVLSAAVQRNRAEQRVTSARAALLQFYFASQKQKEVPIMSLDTTSKDAPYLLGRLMAVLENLQSAAQGQNLNRTIVNRFYGAASTRPGVVFPRLIELSQHHLTKAERKHRWASNLDREMVSILNGIDGIEFPSTLSLEEQGRFALGYYHQRAFRPNKSQDSETEETIPTSEGEINA
jgi:CRISPR-associated protein Csd1